MRHGGYALSWYPAEDADAGDAIIAYQIQVDNSPSFGSPEIDAAFAADPAPTGSFWTLSRPLNTLSGWGNLGMISNYFWRIRAQDSRYAWGLWTDGSHWFTFGIPSPNPAALAMGPSNTVSLSWAAGAENVFIYHATSLGTTNWTPVAGPVNGANSIALPRPTNGMGFFRIGGE